MTLRRFAMPWAASLLLASCSSATEPEISTWQAALSPVAPGTVTGSVAAVTQFGRSRTSISIRQAVADVTYGWRIENGTCSNPGNILGGAAVYPSITADEAGTGEAEASLSDVLASGGIYLVRVFRTTSGSEQIVACGAFEQTR